MLLCMPLIHEWFHDIKLSLLEHKVIYQTEERIHELVIYENEVVEKNYSFLSSS